MDDDDPQLLQVQYKVLSEKLLKLMYFKAKQRLLNFKEQQLWKRYCEKEFGSYSTQDSSVDLYGTSKGVSIPHKKFSSATPLDSKENRSRSASDLFLRQPSSFPKKVIYQKSVISKAPGKPQKAEFTKFEVINISKRDGSYIIENADKAKNEKKNPSQHSRRQPELPLQELSKQQDLIPELSKQVVQTSRKPLTRDFTISRPSSKAVSFLLPQKLQEDRSIAWRAYLKSDPPHNASQSKRKNTTCKSTQTNLVAKDTKENILKTRCSDMQKFKREKQNKSLKHFASQSTQTGNEKEKTIEGDPDEVIQSLVDNLVCDTVQEFDRLESKNASQNTNMQMDNLWSHLCDLESSEEETQRMGTSLGHNDLRKKKQLPSPFSGGQPTALPIVILNKGKKSESDMENKKEGYCVCCDYCRHTRKNTDSSKPLIFTKKSPLPKDQCDGIPVGSLFEKRTLHLSEKEVQTIEDYHHQFSPRHTIHDLSNTNSKTLAEQVSDAILESILSDIAAELTDAPADIVTQIYEQEFIIQ